MVSDVQAMLLAVLRDFRKAHGHAIGKQIEERRGKPMGVGTLYKALHALERQGYVRGDWEEQPPAEYGRPRRRFYEPTGLGETALQEYIEHSGQMIKLTRPRAQGVI